jgi:hypothetical protein
LLVGLADIDRIANGLAVAEHVKSARSLVFTTTVRLVLGIKSLIGLPERYERLWALIKIKHFEASQAALRCE